MEKPVRTALWPGEVDRMKSACRTPREKLVILALSEAGLRAQELGALRSEQLNDSTLTLPGRASPVPVSPELAALLRAQFELTPVFRLGVRQIQRIVRTVALRAQLERPVSPDALRRTSSPEPSRRALEAAADAALDLILVADDHRRFVEVNQAAVDALGIPREEIVGRCIEEFFAEVEAGAVPVAWEAFVAEGFQVGRCTLTANQKRFQYRAKANFVPGLHLSVLRELD